MKTLFLSLFAVVAGAASAQTIRIADNNALHPTGANIYTTLQAAINAAASGDLVYVQPSITSYGDVTVDRPITLRGIGFNTGKDLPLSSTVGNIGLTNTVSNTTNASGTTIQGLVANNIYLGYQTGTFTFTLQNITISNCSLNLIWRENSYMPAKNIIAQNCSIYNIMCPNANINQLLIQGNYIYGGVSFGEYLGANPSNVNGLGIGGTLTSVIISNNIFSQGAVNQFNATISGMIITNNNFMGGNNITNSRFLTNAGYWGGIGLTDAIVSNNIFYGCTPSSTAGPFERNAFSNNLSFGTTADALPPAGTGAGNTGANNQVSVDPKFVNAAYNTAWAATMDFTLQAGSPAINAGSDGTNIGITGGAYPITGGNITLKPTSAPVIITLNPAAMVPQNQPIATNIKAKSN